MTSLPASHSEAVAPRGEGGSSLSPPRAPDPFHSPSKALVHAPVKVLAPVALSLDELGRDPQPELGGSFAPGASAAPRLPRLLAIDDSTMIHALLKEHLRRERIEIHAALQGGEGIEAARSLRPDVILLDIKLPDIDGFAALAALKADATTRDIPVILISGATGPDTVVKGLDMGAIDFIRKPFDLAELTARVRSAVRIRSLIRLLDQRARIDGLTGLWNRAYFDQRLREEASAAQRHDGKLALILCDVDRFKEVNDTYGHPFGDMVLEEFGRMLHNNRASDVACRYGGEEFAVIVTNSAGPNAGILAERVRQRLAAHTWPGVDRKITASFGVAELGSGGDARALLAAADAALYAAKQRGRDSVVLAPSSARD